MKNTFLLLIITLTNYGILYGQEKSLNPEYIKYQKGIGIESFYQSNYGLGLGGILSQNIGHKIAQNYSVGIYSDVILVNSPIVGPRIKLNYNYLGIFGVNLNFSNYYRNGINDFRITPEVNFSLFGIANLFIGYSFKVAKNSFSELNEFRLGLNLSLVNSN